jgi:methylated-DNA-[protein]-cysteine S-methyltransferase
MELEEYFAGWRTTFGVPIKPEGTPFQKQVWLALRQIAPGTTATYGQLATKIGKPTAARAVGTAIGRNPICIIIPCHRIVGSDGKIGDFVAGPIRKQQLLDVEGVRLENLQPIKAAAPHLSGPIELLADAEPA